MISVEPTTEHLKNSETTETSSKNRKAEVCRVRFERFAYSKLQPRNQSISRIWFRKSYPLSFLYPRLKNGTYYAVAMSVRPSVRPRFPDFSSTCFEISIWNLVYTFSRWHDMSSLSCITIGPCWPSLPPKVGQTHFLQSWPHKSR